METLESSLVILLSRFGEIGLNHRQITVALGVKFIGEALKNTSKAGLVERIAHGSDFHYRLTEHSRSQR